MVQPNDTASQVPAPPRLTARYLNRDLSWLKFNERVLDQVGKPGKTVFEWLTFLQISASNLDEFFMVRIGRLYNERDTERAREDKLHASPAPILDRLLMVARASFQKHHQYFLKKVKPLCEANHFAFVQDITLLSAREKKHLKRYFEKTISPRLTPMVLEKSRALPTLRNKALVFGIVTHQSAAKRNQENKKITFIQLPQTLPRFYKFVRNRHTFLVPIERIVREYLPLFFKDLVVHTATLFRVIRNGDFSLEERDDIGPSLVEALKKKLKARSKGKIVRLEIEEGHDPYLLNLLQDKWNIDPGTVFLVPTKSLMDLTGLQQLVQSSHIGQSLPVLPISYPAQCDGDLFEVLKQQDILLHHPYNSIDLVIDFLERAAIDPHVLAIKMTIYRLARDSAVTAALRKAAACGKHVSVLIEIKARFDEAYNMQEAKRLEQAGCLVIYSRSSIKTHAKIMMIVRKEGNGTMRYVHLSSGNYNEETAKRYADVSLMTTDTVYANDVSAFFDVITGHALPKPYTNLIAAPLSIRGQLISMIRQEVHNAQQGLSCGIVIKVNALEDKAIIEALYEASEAGVPIRLIVRGICCLIPQRPGLSTNIKVHSIVGNVLEHARIFYFHNQGNAQVYVGSADIMVRSFEKRIESLFLVKHIILKQQVINILAHDLRDNTNSYLMQEDGTYVKVKSDNEAAFDIHQAFFKVTVDEVVRARLFA
ncbi:MAG: polyphosphate kinase 1 [Bacteroidota bacterium]